MMLCKPRCAYSGVSPIGLIGAYSQERAHRVQPRGSPGWAGEHFEHGEHLAPVSIWGTAEKNVDSHHQPACVLPPNFSVLPPQEDRPS